MIGTTPPDTRVGGSLSFIPHNYRYLPVPSTSAAMIERSDLSSSNRTLSASSLKDRLSKLSVTPLRPVAALQARVECVHSIPAVSFMPLPFTPLNPSSLSCPQFCPGEHPSGAPPPDGLRCVMDEHDSNLCLPHPIPSVRAFPRPFVGWSWDHS